MSHVSLSLEQSPPLSVPVRFFLTAPLFGIIAAISLLIAGPEALTSRWTPALLSSTHLLTLGYISMVMMGAMLQLLPVLAATPIVQARWLSILLHSLLSLGTAALGIGLLGAYPWLLQSAVFVLSITFLAFIIILLATLRHSPSTHASIKTMRLALLALLVTATLGILLAAGHAWPSIHLMRHYTELHLVWGLFGWVGLLTIGIAYQVVPMFQMTAEYPAIMRRVLTPLLFVLLLIWSWGQLGLPMYVIVSKLTSYLLALGFIIFCISTLYLQIKRRRKVQDITLLFWRLGMVSLLLCVLLWASAQFFPLADYLPHYPIMLGMLMIGGFVISVINGMLYKIIPFLVWLHLQKSTKNRQARRQIPNVKKIISYKYARWQLLIHFIALLFFLGATHWSQSLLIYIAASCLALSCLILLINLLDALRTYQRCLALIATFKDELE